MEAKQYGWPITAPVKIIGITRNFVNFAKTCILSCLSIFDHKEWLHCAGFVSQVY